MLIRSVSWPILKARRSRSFLTSASGSLSYRYSIKVALRYLGLGQEVVAVAVSVVGRIGVKIEFKKVE
jgi:hypothetical protein